jgi:membrane protease YdiL (CAAX protease family)
VENINAIENNDPSLVGLPIPIAETRPTPDNPPWGSWAALGVWAASIAFVLIFPMIFLGPYLVTSGLIAQREQIESVVRTDPTAVFLQILAIIPAHIFTIALAWFIVTQNRKYSFREMLGWEWGGFRIYHAVLISVAFYALAIGAVAIFGDVENEFEVMLKSSKYVIYLVAFFAIFTAPIVEEVVYRGLLYSAFQRTMGTVLAVILVTFLFAVIHAPQYSMGLAPDYAVMSVLILLSLTLTMIRVKTGNLLPCIVLHTVFNAFQSLIMIAEPFIRPYIENSESTIGLFFK